MSEKLERKKKKKKEERRKKEKKRIKSREPILGPLSSAIENFVQNRN